MRDRKRTPWMLMLSAFGVVLSMVMAANLAAADADKRLVVAIASPYDTLDPHLILDTRRTDVRLHVYDGLFRWMDGPLRIAPWLAQSYTVSEDGRTFRFTLRSDAKFHDGREVRAADVVYSVERILALKRGVAPLLNGLVSPGSTKAIDPQTVEFSLSRPSPLFLTLLPEIAIVNSELLKANELNNDWGRAWLQFNEAGSGAYLFKSRDPSGGVVLERFGGHWSSDGGSAPIKEVELRLVLDPEQRVEYLLKGDVHVAEGNFLPHQTKRLREAKDITVAEIDSPRIFVGLLNAGRDPFKTQATRKAIAQAFHAESFIAGALPQGATAVTIPLPPTLGAPPQGFQRPAYDIAAATEALAKAKVPARDITIGAIAGDPHSERAALIMMSGLARLGVTSRIVSEPWPAVAARMRDEKQMYDILFLWKGTRYLDANNWLGEMYDCDMFGTGNSSWYCNRDIDRLIKEARGISDARLRKEAFEKAAALLAEDQASIFIASARKPIAYSRKIKGLRFTPVGETIDPRFATMN